MALDGAALADWGGTLTSSWLGVGLTSAVLIWSALCVWSRRRQLQYHLGATAALLPASYTGPDGSTRWAVVTGGARGIGLQFVRELARGGWSCVIVDRAGDELDAAVADAVAEGKKAGLGVHAVKVDCDAADVPAAVDAVSAAVAAAVSGEGMAGPLLLLVNNVGVSTPEPTLFQDHDPGQLTELIQVNAHFAARLTHQLLPRIAVRARLADRRGGILFVSSAASLVPAAYVSVYAASKAFLNSLARSLRAELMPEPVDVLSVTPGYVRAGNTPRWMGRAEGAAAALRLPTPEAVAKASLLLLPTSLWHTVSPLMLDAATTWAMDLVPERLLAAIIVSRHREQRARLMDLLAMPNTD